MTKTITTATVVIGALSDSVTNADRAANRRLSMVPGFSAHADLSSCSRDGPGTEPPLLIQPCESTGEC
jgi:hypothetical protein